MFLMSSQVKKSGQCQLRDKSTSTYFSIVSLSTDSVIVDHAVCLIKYVETVLFRPGCIKRCQVVVKVNIMSSDLIGGYLTFYLNQPIKWTDFRLDALLADTMLTKLYTTGL
jgi:hypothetical protein